MDNPLWPKESRPATPGDEPRGTPNCREVDLNVERGKAGAVAGRALHGRGGRRLCQKRQDSAVDGAQLVAQPAARGQREGDPALLGGDQPRAGELVDRRWAQLAAKLSPERLEP